VEIILSIMRGLRMDKVESGTSCERMLRSVKGGVERERQFSAFLPDGGSRASLLQFPSLSMDSYVKQNMPD
jgi:hypothetical protein